MTMALLIPSRTMKPISSMLLLGRTLDPVANYIKEPGDLFSMTGPDISALLSELPQDGIASLQHGRYTHIMQVDKYVEVCLVISCSRSILKSYTIFY